MGKLAHRFWAVGTVAGAAAVGRLAAADAADVYARLDKPRWAPPAWLFGPAWGLLYLANVGAGLRSATATEKILHTAQLALNAAWTPLFFGRRRQRAALSVIAALDAAVIAEIVVLARRDRVAAALLVPYAGWLLYATALTAAVEDPRAA
ncbi:TspO/MBR family protein [Rarobacter incanus]|uniref:TspO/MBR related protein n=1 Tax=Rarobacter incanus TaxID=153494 RepID=A0A542SNU3_9MICO|nr:TspO/MBR family protein [Rarobacter incanus]TQK76279.1 TspO/MBR related protein [Rarobacter incanus]